MKVELLELYKESKKIRVYLPQFSDLIYPSLGSKNPLDMELNKGYIEHMIQQRKDARKSKNYLEGDRIRKALKYKGIELYDKDKDTTVWDWNLETLNLFTLLFKLPSNNDISKYVLASINLYYRRCENNVSWEIHHSDVHNVFNNFHLSTDYALFTRGEKYTLVNDWNPIEKTMIVGGTWEV